MNQDIIFFSTIIFEIEQKIFNIKILSLIIIILSFILLVNCDFLPKILIICIEFICMIVIFQSCDQISLNIYYTINILSNSQLYGDFFSKDFKILFRIDIWANYTKILCIILLILNVLVTIVDIL